MSMRRILAGWVVAAGAPALAAAQIVDCSGLSEPGPKILVDEISVLGAAGAGPVPALARQMKASVENALESLELQDDMPKVVRCLNRRPRDGSEFDRGLTEQLFARNALLEIWGTVEPENDGHAAFLGFLLVPARREELESGRPRGLYETVFRSGPGSNPADALREFDRSEELAAFTVLTIGLRAARVGDVDQAYALLCNGVLRLAPPGTQPAPRQAALVRHALERAGEAMRKARSDPAYQGHLKLLSEQQAARVCEGRP